MNDTSYTPKVLFCKMVEGAIMPSYAKEGDAGMDVYALESVCLRVGETRLLRTGIRIAIPEGYFGSARERSGMAMHGIRLGGGVIDSGYRGEIKIIFTNLGIGTYGIEAGHRICQIIIQPCATAAIVEVETLPDSERGTAGFGSSGR